MFILSLNADFNRMLVICHELRMMRHVYDTTFCHLHGLVKYESMAWSYLLGDSELWGLICFTSKWVTSFLININRHINKLIGMLPEWEIPPLSIRGSWVWNPTCTNWFLYSKKLRFTKHLQIYEFALEENSMRKPVIMIVSGYELATSHI